MNHPGSALCCEDTSLAFAEALVTLPNGIADLERSEVRFLDGRQIELSERENELLSYLANHPGRVISRDEILQEVWGLNPVHIHTRTIDMHIVHLRAKLGDDSRSPRLLHTVRGEGYIFTPGKGVRV